MISSSSVLDTLENESIEIFREAAAALRKPVMLYSIGKDSSVILHLARKAFAPGPVPFPLMHIDATWKFKETTSFRDATAKEVGFELIVQTNHEGIKDGITPFSMGALGCYPLTAGVDSDATTMQEVVQEVTELKQSERATRLIDGDKEDSMEKKKTEGYF